MQWFKWLRRPAPEAPAEESSAAAPSEHLAVGTTRISPYAPNAGRIMVTDGGPHPASAWAQITAEHLAPFDPALSGAKRRAAVQLQLDLAAAIEEHHGRVQESERAKLVADSAHLLKPLDPSEHVGGGVASFLAAAAKSEWAEHFAKPEVRELIRREVHVHMKSIQLIEHGWHADRLLKKDPAHPHALAWRALRHSGVKET